ncbi:unnamed protein product [Owenia fusiformis]|uniref:DNA-(apurinic or apyrimidinic site) endonuclease n=1 Tax=Owenia fusiformis TaxID=6347 RepID=A0A8S4NLP6_OWEFU|nr:unnamed protein product [Owenia fusiformis]
MRILTWNINGIRASKVPLKSLFDSLEADIICLQETKVTRDQLDEPSAIVEGYNSYFSFSKARSGYSGVATFCRDQCTPVAAEEGLSGVLDSHDSQQNVGCYGDHSMFTDEELQSLDNEGRTVITKFKISGRGNNESHLVVINVYCPRADPEKPERLVYKLRFYDLLQARAEALIQSGCHVIVLGDVNTSHKPIDHCDPKDPDFTKQPGRIWMDNFLQNSKESQEKDSLQFPTRDTSDNENHIGTDAMHAPGGKFVDTYRKCHPDTKEAFTCWNTSTGARKTNYGTRIDYIFSDVNFVDCLSDCVIMPHVEGSDHCPVSATFNCDIISQEKCPPFCTAWYPEFAGRQSKLSSFFRIKSRNMPGESVPEEIETEESVHVDSAYGSQSYSSGSQCSDTGCQYSNDTWSSEEKPAKNNQTASIKRHASGKTDSSQPSSKKFKPNPSKPVQKQSSLMAFFGKNSTSKTSQGKCQDTQVLTKSKAISVDAKTSETKISSCDIQCQEKTVTSLQCHEKTVAQNNAQSMPSEIPVAAQASWKALFRGPPPAPLCKGHKEKCVLRTVKKDSLNKGRQFYCCARPEGHKSNPEARCDTFEWIDKKKIKQN